MSISNSINPGIKILERIIENYIRDAIDSLGIMYKIFVRAKDANSIEGKIKKKEDDKIPYKANGKKMQGYFFEALLLQQPGVQPILFVLGG